MKQRVLSIAIRFRRPLEAAILLAAFVAVVGLAPSGAAQGKAVPNTVSDPNLSGSLAAVSPEGGPLVAPGPAPDIIVLFTGRVVGYVEPCG